MARVANLKRFNFHKWRVVTTHENRVEWRRADKPRRAAEPRRGLETSVVVERRRMAAQPHSIELRRAAEAYLSSWPAAEIGKPKEIDFVRLMHELQVHQIELVIQNSELQKLRSELESSLARYVELYDFAPVGYFSFDRLGIISQANLAGARLLGIERSLLIGRRFSDFISAGSRSAFAGLFVKCLAGSTFETCDIELISGSSLLQPLFVQFETGISDNNESFRAAMLDISAKKKAEAALSEREAFNLAILNSVADEIAVLDRDGVICLVNLPWQRFAIENSKEIGTATHNTEIGTNYLTADEPDNDIASQEMTAARRGIQAVLNRSQSKFTMEYPCHSPTQNRWFSMRVSPLESNESGGAVISHTDISERKLMEEQVRQMAFHDPLTKLPNRRLLNDRLCQTMAASKRSACYGALMFLDLDNFKPLNDAHGHEIGNQLLIEVAERLKMCVRETDTVTRFGGDEFVVMISELDINQVESKAQANQIAEKIRASLSDPYLLAIPHVGQAKTTLQYRCTVSIGVALFVNHEPSQDALIKLADKAMYRAKAGGRNAICFND